MGRCINQLRIAERLCECAMNSLESARELAVNPTLHSAMGNPLSGPLVASVNLVLYDKAAEFIEKARKQIVEAIEERSQDVLVD